METKVSIIVPVYNREKEIEACLKSIMSQTLDEIEIIVINDGSTDDTAAAVTRICDSRIKLVTTKNQGQGIARNVGLDMATGEYVGFVDSDDTILPEMFSDMYQKAKEHDADMVQCAINYIKDSEVSIRPKLNDELVTITDAGEYAKAYFKTGKHRNEVCNKLFKTEFLRSNNIRFSDTREVYSEDLKLCIDVLEKLRRVYFLKKAYYNYYMSPDGHFMKAPKERLLKICTLYSEAIKGIENQKVTDEVKSTAIDHILLYAKQVAKSKTTAHILSSEQVKDYIRCEMRYRKSVRFAIFGVGMLTMPAPIKLLLLKLY